MSSKKKKKSSRVNEVYGDLHSSLNDQTAAIASSKSKSKSTPNRRGSIKISKKKNNKSNSKEQEIYELELNDDDSDSSDDSLRKLQQQYQRESQIKDEFKDGNNDEKEQEIKKLEEDRMELVHEKMTKSKGNRRRRRRRGSNDANVEVVDYDKISSNKYKTEKPSKSKQKRRRGRGRGRKKGKSSYDSDDESADEESEEMSLEDNLMQFEKIAATGQLFAQYFEKRRKPTDRIVKVTFDRTGKPKRVSWGSGSRHSNTINFSDITVIAWGHWTPVFDAKKDGLNHKLCLSIVGKKKTLDIHGQSKEVVELWVKGLRKLLGQSDEEAQRLSRELLEGIHNSKKSVDSEEEEKSSKDSEVQREKKSKGKGRRRKRKDSDENDAAPSPKVNNEYLKRFYLCTWAICIINLYTDDGREESTVRTRIYSTKRG